MINGTQDLIKSATDTLKRLSGLKSLEGETRIRKLEQQKLTRDFQVVLDRFQQIQRLSAEKSREYVAKARAQSHQLDFDEDATE